MTEAMTLTSYGNQNSNPLHCLPLLHCDFQTGPATQGALEAKHRINKKNHTENLAINVCNQNCSNARHREQKKPHHMKTWTLHTNILMHPNQYFTHDLVTQSVKLRLMEIMIHLMPVKLPMDSNVPVKLPLNAAPGSNFSMSQLSLSPRFHHCCRDLRTGP